MTSTTTDAATRYAGLNAVAAGIAAAQKQAAADLEASAAEHGISKGTVNTPFGPVTLRENKAKREIAVHDDAAFIAWAKEQHPEAVEVVPAFERLRPLDRLAILTGRFVVVAGAVVDSLTGEAVPFAEVVDTPAGPPSPSYGASAEQKAAKKAAIEWAADRAGLLTGLVQQALEAGQKVEG
jgi:hypothetical protein